MTTKSFHQSEPATKSKTIFYSRWKWISAIYRRVNFNFATKYKCKINFPPWIVANANKLAMSSEHYVFHYYCMLLCFSSLLWLHSLRFSCSLVTQLTENHVPISNETAGKWTVCPFSKLSILFPFYLNFVLKISNTQPCRTQNIIMLGVVFNVLLCNATDYLDRLDHPPKRILRDLWRDLWLKPLKLHKTRLKATPNGIVEVASEMQFAYSLAPTVFT